MWEMCLAKRKLEKVNAALLASDQDDLKTPETNRNIHCVSTMLQLKTTTTKKT